MAIHARLAGATTLLLAGLLATACAGGAGTSAPALGHSRHPQPSAPDTTYLLHPWSRAPRGTGPSLGGGPYAPVRCVAGWVYVSGQIAFDPASGQLSRSDDIRVQARLALGHLRSALASVGAMPSDVVKTTVLLRDAADMAAMNEVYREVFVAAPLPARTTIPGVDFGGAPIRIEIDAIAALPTGSACPGT